MKKKKSFVLDTNVLLHDPACLEEFPGATVIIPMTVLEELDSMKRFTNELGHNSRSVMKAFAYLKQLGEGNLHTGVKIPNGSTIRIYADSRKMPHVDLGLDSKSNRIIMTAHELKEAGERVVFVSKSLASRVKAEVIGVEAQDYEKMKVHFDNIYPGCTAVECQKADIDQLSKNGQLDREMPNMFPNEYAVLETADKNASAIARYDQKNKRFVSLGKMPENIWGIRPRNAEQRIAADLLLRDEVKLVTLVGPAGTGKTLIALACALRKMFDEGVYSRLLISRPIVPLGKDIGYLPGTKEEKLEHWMQPINDNLKVLCDSTGSEPNETLRWVLEGGRIEMEAVTYIRGRSLSRMIIIVDEAQNLTPHEIKTIISRAGEGSKVIFTGDPTQIDNPYLDQDSNGLSYTVERFKEYAIAGHIYLRTTERSELAALAAKIM